MGGDLAKAPQSNLAKAPQAELARTLRQTDDPERRIDAACAAGDQLRFGEIAALDPELRQALANIAGDDSRDWDALRFEAAIALCEARDHLGAVLVETLDDRDRRFDACKALSRLQREEVRQGLHALTARFFLSWSDRLVAAAACAVLGDKEGGQYFERMLVSRWFGARRAMALHLLGELRHPDAFSVLTAILENTQEPARAVAIRALGHLGDARAVAILKALAPNAGEDLTEDLRYALDLLGAL
jgi:HEAT repeat protein